MNEKQIAVVAGGSGGIGEGIVVSLLEAGYRVYVPSRPGDHSDRLRGYVNDTPELRIIPADLCDESAVSAMLEKILSQDGRIDAVVVSVGADYYGHRLHRMPRQDFDRSIQDNLVTHFNMQRIFVDQLRKQNHGSYITLIGPEAESIRPDGGVMSIMASAQKMMARVLAQEAFDSDIRVHTLTAHTTIKTRSRGNDANYDWISARDLGEYVLGLLSDTLPGSHDTLHELQDVAHVQALLKRAKA
jgi:NAD(P)-dependent dehydrogenase (short-subunit alcohol dehydrogenase family)